MEIKLTENKGVGVKKCILLVIGFEVMIIVTAVAYYGYSLEALQAVTRFSGRFSLIIFSIIFMFEMRASTLRNIFSKQFYLVFAVAHGIHLIELSLFVTGSGATLILYRLAGGLLAYAMIFIMPFLHTRYLAGKIKKGTFVKLSTIYLYYLWAIFVMTYLPRIQGTLPQAGGTFAEHVFLFAYVLAILMVRITMLFKNRTESITISRQSH